MGNADNRPIRKGDIGFLFRLLGGAAVVILLAILVLGLMDQSRLGSCAARGFLQVTDPPSSD
ncbi:MAG: hypothetical protein WBM48_08230 [Polyangiales bacterium]